LRGGLRDRQNGLLLTCCVESKPLTAIANEYVKDPHATLVVSPELLRVGLFFAFHIARKCCAEAMLSDVVNDAGLQLLDRCEHIGVQCEWHMSMRRVWPECNPS
jgi:hypothetical protein